jgi:iron-sulfur cluster assembly protein
MSVTLTESAARHVKEMLAKRGSGIGLRISTRKSGCSGYAYQVDYVDEPAEGDHVYESQGVQVIINEQDLAHLDGLQIDYVKQNMLNEGLEFNNPNVKEMCGCGESVSF